MLQQKPFLVISSFNNTGEHLTKYGSGYVLFDQSNDPEWDRANLQLGAIKASHVGHDLNNILNFVVANYDDLPEKIAFLKSNIIGRHCTQEYLELNINNDFYTHFYHDPKVELGKRVNDVPFPGMYLEVNNSWYVRQESHKLFCTFDQLADRLFDNYKPGRYLLFSPGACFLITKEHILRHPKSLYLNLSDIASYDFFPDEAYMVERVLPMIFMSGYNLRPDIDDLKIEISRKLQSPSHVCQMNAAKPRVKQRLTNILKRCLRIQH